jgi:hypothetical protein
MNHSKKLSVAAILAIAMLSSCIKDKDLSQIGNKPETYSEATLSIGGECNTTETPMSRASDQVREIYGITVSQWIRDTGGRLQSKPYAYGIFDDVSNLKLNLLDGYKYRVSCTMVENAKDSLLHEENKFARPFSLDRNGEVFGEIKNRFLLADQPDGSLLYLFDADNSKVGTEHQDGISRPWIKRYHGVIDSLETHTTGNELELYRRYFAVKFKANGLHENYRLEIQLDDSPKWILTPDKNETEYTYVSFRSLTGKVTPNSILSDNASFKVELFKEDESQGTEIMKYNRSFKRNYRSTIVISDIDNFGTDAGLSIKIADEGELEDEPVTDLPWQGGI